MRVLTAQTYSPASLSPSDHAVTIGDRRRNRPAVRVRPARPSDLAALEQLIRQHAQYERAEQPRPDIVQKLRQLLFGGNNPRLHCFVAELKGEVIGYATCSVQISTWAAGPYLHLDCLYLADAHRNRGVGPMLMEAVQLFGVRAGLVEMQWQTPTWNEAGIRFYDRLGATKRLKQRYTMRLATPQTQADLSTPQRRTKRDGPVQQRPHETQNFLLERMRRPWT
jgi:ribosomal protein S18 acetylase RimI-like enzyme